MVPNLVQILWSHAVYLVECNGLISASPSSPNANFVLNP